MMLTPRTYRCPFRWTKQRGLWEPVSIKHGLRTADHGLRTGYKIQTGYKMRTADYVYKNSFRKVKLR